MKGFTERELKLTCRLLVLETFVVALVREVPELRSRVEMSETLARDLLGLGGSIPGHPEAADMLSSELQEAYAQLIQRVLDQQD
jgi:hypothetical protein